MTTPLFMPGRVLATSGDDKAANDESLKDLSRLLSAYILKTGVKIWVITEAADDHANRAATTVLLPDEY